MPMPNDITSIDAILEPTKGVIKHVKDLISQLDPKQLLDGEVSFAAEDVKSAYRIWLSSLVAKLSLSRDVTFTDKKQLHDQGKEIVDRAGSFVRSFERAGLIPPGQITRNISTRAELLEKEADAGVKLLEHFSQRSLSDREDIAKFVAEHDTFEAI